MSIVAYILDVMQEEYDRLIGKKAFYVKLMQELKHGSIQMKKIKGREYAYLCYREKDKVISQYIRPEELEKVKAEITQYKQSKDALKNINANLKLIRRML